MPRPIAPLPLQGAAPQLTPTARPLQINIGATPPPSRSPLGELGQAFRDFNPVLHGLLQSAAAQADHDALALGELEAVKSKAAERLGELDTIIKDGVDNGTIPHVRAPAFERGFRSRVGSELAQSAFQEALLSQLPNVTKVDGYMDAEGNPMTHQAAVEKVVTETRQKYFGQLHANDIYAKTAFDQTAQGVVAGFRQRAAEGYTAAYKAAGEQAMADDNSERLMNLATAPETDAVFFRDNVKAGLDQLRAELPKAQVNQFFLQNSVAPTVAKLISQKKFTEAKNIIDEMGMLDVTGKGGLLGQTSVGKSILSDLTAKVTREQRMNGEEEWTALHRERDTKKIAGETSAGQDLLDMRNANGGNLPQDRRFQMIETFRKANPQDPIATQAYADTVNHEYENEAKFRSDPTIVSNFETGMRSLSKTDLALQRTSIELLANLGKIAPSDRTRLIQHIDKLETLYGAYDEGDVNRFKKDLYASRDPAGFGTTINFGDGIGGGGDAKDPNSTSGLWVRLPNELKDRHEALVTAYFQQAVESDLVNRVKDPLRIPAEKAATLDNATTKARAYALTLLRDLSGVKEKREAEKKVAEQAIANRRAAIIGGLLTPPTPTYTEKLTDSAGNTVEVKKPYRLPGPWFVDFSPYDVQTLGPSPTRDRASIYFPARSFGEWLLPGIGGTSQTVDLPALAKDILENKSPEAAAQSKQVYGYTKALLGFTPDEVKNGKTKHGVAIDPAAIDPRYISVFTNRRELEANWNNGEPTDLFNEIGDAVDPEDRMTGEQFYLAQLALLTRKK